MQEASAGVARRDFALEIPEELEGTRGSLVTNLHNMQDP
jgi:hypothetical protein